MNESRITPATTPAQIDTVRALFREYAEATGHFGALRMLVAMKRGQRAG